MTYKNKGFTLIELMVVVAIIGILAAVISFSLSGARNSGANASVKSNLKNVQTQAELAAIKNGGSFDGIICDGGTAQDSTIKKALGEALDNSEATSWGVLGSKTGSCADERSSYVVSLPLKASEDGKDYWCVDSDGFSGLASSVDAGKCKE